MNQNYKLRIDQLRESKPTHPDGGDEQEGLSHYPDSGYARNLRFKWPNGKQYFLSYSHLEDGEFDPLGEKNTINLFLSSKTVIIKGYALEELYESLSDYLPKVIEIIDERYASGERNVVTEVIIQPKDQQ